jgi:hypothetical protein
MSFRAKDDGQQKSELSEKVPILKISRGTVVVWCRRCTKIKTTINVVTRINVITVINVITIL